MASLETSAPEINEADRLLPLHTVIRIIRQALPDGCKISAEAKESILEATTELIGFVTNHCVEEYMLQNKRKTMTTDDILRALHDLDLDMFAPAIRAYLKQRKTRTKTQQKAASVEPESEQISLDEEQQNTLTNDMTTTHPAS